MHFVLLGTGSVCLWLLSDSTSPLKGLKTTYRQMTEIPGEPWGIFWNECGGSTGHVATQHVQNSPAPTAPGALDTTEPLGHAL